MIPVWRSVTVSAIVGIGALSMLVITTLVVDLFKSDDWGEGLVVSETLWGDAFWSLVGEMGRAATDGAVGVAGLVSAAVLAVAVIQFDHIEGRARGAWRRETQGPPRIRISPTAVGVGGIVAGGVCVLLVVSALIGATHGPAGERVVAGSLVLTLPALVFAWLLASVAGAITQPTRIIEANERRARERAQAALAALRQQESLMRLERPGSPVDAKGAEPWRPSTAECWRALMGAGFLAPAIGMVLAFVSRPGYSSWGEAALLNLLSASIIVFGNLLVLLYRQTLHLDLSKHRKLWSRALILALALLMVSLLFVNITQGGWWGIAATIVWVAVALLTRWVPWERLVEIGIGRISLERAARVWATYDLTRRLDDSNATPPESKAGDGAPASA